MKRYEAALPDMLWEVEDRRTRRAYRCVVSKKRTRKKKRKNGKPMTHAAKVAGWDEAALRWRREHPLLYIRQTSSITMEEAMQMDTNSRAAAKRTSGKLMGHDDNLLGADFGLLLVWKLSADGGQVKRYHCLCACGKPCEVPVAWLLNSKQRDCGHKLKDKRRQQRHRKRQKLARQGRERAHRKRHWGMAA